MRVGKTDKPTAQVAQRRSIPTHIGKTTTGRFKRFKTTKHPYAYRENWLAELQDARKTGASPRV